VITPTRPVPEPLPPLPALRDPARAVLMLVNPRLLFLYWTSDAALAGRLGALAGPAEVIVEAVGGSERTIARVPFDFRSGSWYLAIPVFEGTVRARLGAVERGRFFTLLESNELPMPRIAPGGGPELWIDRRALRAGRAEPAPPPATPLRLERRERAAAGTTARVMGAEDAGTSPVRAKWSRDASSPRRLETAWTTGRMAAPPAVTPRPPWKAGVPPIGIADPAGYLAFVLHAHLPFVRHPQREFFLEEQWLFEGITETYLPILDALDHLERERVPARLTISVSPTLAAMLRDPVLMGKYERHLGRMCQLAGREVARTRHDAAFSPVTGFYWDRLHRLQHLFVEVYGRDLLAAFARLEDAGMVELITCAATHAFLPHHRIDPATVRAQVAQGVAEHRRQLGRSPRGLWLPECAYYEGLDQVLMDAGLDYFFVDTHAVENASAPPRFGVHAPILCPSGVAAFGRDAESSVQVWSSEEGYPGDPAYRDFYRDIGYDLDEAYVAPYLDPAGGRGMTGFKYHRITGRTDHKEPYRRDEAVRTAAWHAGDFVRNRRLQIDWLAGGMDRPPLVVSMYDAELFGHWWFEGPDWLEQVLRGLPRAGVAVISPTQYLEEHPVAQVARPAASSWGERGYYDVWLTDENDWILPPLHEAGRRMDALARAARAAAPGARRVLAQAGRELMLAQASDWPFILRNRTTPEYARRRVRTHLDRFDRLAGMIERGPIDEGVVAAIEAEDNLFPDLDPALWSRP
jgi:1,4-alpha-glucan branching enzyme